MPKQQNLLLLSLGAEMAFASIVFEPTPNPIQTYISPGLMTRI